jgi:hypothetical protein
MMGGKDTSSVTLPLLEGLIAECEQNGDIWRDEDPMLLGSGGGGSGGIRWYKNVLKDWVWDGDG